MASLFEVGAADVADTSNDYYTPRWIFTAAGLTFDMDVAAPVDPVRRTCPARRYLTPIEDGLTHEWRGVVWMNPPYSDSGRWVQRFAEHRSGLALLPGFPQKAWMGTLMRCAEAVAFLSVEFYRWNIGAACKDKRKETKTRVPFPLVLAACGEMSVAALARVAAADQYIGGAYHVRPGGPVLT